MGKPSSASPLSAKPSRVSRRPSTATWVPFVWTIESIPEMKSATWKKSPVKLRSYGITPSPAVPIVAPIGSSAAAASVGATVAEAGTAAELPAAVSPDGGVLGAGVVGAGAGAMLEGVAELAASLIAMPSNLTFERPAIVFSSAIREEVSSLCGTALPSTTSCW